MKQHLAAQQLRALSSGCMDERQTIQAAEHIAVCPQCALQFADLVQENLSQPPDGFAERVCLSIGQWTDKRLRDYRLYCIRVAACVALIIVGVLAMMRFSAPALSLPAEMDSPVIADGKGYFDEPEQKDNLYYDLQSFVDRIIPFNQEEEESQK